MATITPLENTSQVVFSNKRQKQVVTANTWTLCVAMLAWKIHTLSRDVGLKAKEIRATRKGQTILEKYTYKEFSCLWQEKHIFEKQCRLIAYQLETVENDAKELTKLLLFCVFIWFLNYHFIPLTIPLGYRISLPAFFWSEIIAQIQRPN